MKWEDKLDNLVKIAAGLKSIHEKGLIHHDFHCDPSKRPKAQELYKLVDNLYDHGFAKYKGEIIKKQAEEADKINEKFTSTSLPYNEPKNAIDNKVDVGEYSESIEAIDFTKLNLDENN
ncbi:kinase-like domain-containing protein [Rhizophagus irregularis DAOM 181602=DAOM 197198]|nr:kinase-like domain-containing protein [Rhizophagus irregularis DAOM 181602=DAOM 197198]